MKAVVLETRGREAAVLAMDGGVYIANGKYHVGETIDYREAKRPSVRQWAAAAAAMVVLLGASAGLWVDRNYVAYAEVSLDVNPSIVHTVNRRDRVLGVRAVNEDAKSIVESLEQDGIRFATLTDAVDRTMVLLEDEGYLDEAQADYVLVNVSADDGDRKTRLTEEVEEAMVKTMERDATLEYRIDTSDRVTAKDARDSGMSTGRYAAWKQEEEKPDDARPDMKAYSDMPVREIMEGPATDGDRPTPGNEGAEVMPQIETTSPSTPKDLTEPEGEREEDRSEAVLQENPEPSEADSTANGHNAQEKGEERSAPTQPADSQSKAEKPAEPELVDGESNGAMPADQRQPNGNAAAQEDKSKGQASPQAGRKDGGGQAGKSAGGQPDKAQGNSERGGRPSGSRPGPGR